MKKIILRLLSCAIVLALLAVLTIFVINPLFKEEEHNVAEVNIMYYEGPTKALKMENDQISFELDPKTTHFKVTDKASGREWLSNPADASKDAKAVAANKETLSATDLLYFQRHGGDEQLQVLHRGRQLQRDPAGGWFHPRGLRHRQD